MKSIAHSRSYTAAVPWSRRHVRYLCLGIVCLVSLVGCVPQSQYETVTAEIEGLRGELLRAEEDIQALEQQKQALHKLNIDGEKLLTGIKAELQQARVAHAEYRAEQNRLEGLKAKARALQSEHAKHMQGIKAAKRDQLKMQAVIDRYEREMEQAPDINDMLRISQATEASGEHARLVATVTPLPSGGSSPARAASQMQPAAIAPSAPSVAAPAVGSPAPSPSVTPAAAPVQSAQPAAAPVPSVAPNSTPQSTPANDSWISSLTGWLSSLWGWLFP